MLQLSNSIDPVQRSVLKMTIVVLIVLVALTPFTAGTQEFDFDREAFEEKLASCIYRQDCYELDDIQKETETVRLVGVKCPESESGFGQVFVISQLFPIMTASGSFEFQGLEQFWRFRDGATKHNDYLIIVHPDGSGSYYEFSSREEVMPNEPSDKFACIDRSDIAVEFVMGILGY